MERMATAIGGCFEIIPRVFADDRGRFVKTFQREVFQAWGLAAEFVEQFYSVSKKGVLRGMHFQLPPHDHVKLVACLAGRVLDAVVDLRRESATYGRHALVELTAEKANMLYVPVGLAHGFYTLSDSALVLYNTTHVYAPGHDTRIR